MESPTPRAPAGLQECSIQEKIDLEVRMREGIWKLLSLSTQKDQILQAVKNLMVCNARITAYTSVLQKLEDQTANQAARHDEKFGGKARTACRGKVALSDIRIPLMWKDTDHFSNKERTQRYAIFCLFRMGAKLFDTDMVIVDPTVTDICFENVSIFDDAGPDFGVKVEVYSCCAEESSLASAPRKLAKKLKTSISKATGKKLSALLQQENHEACRTLPSTVSGTKYRLLAHTTLTLESAEDSFKTHNLSVSGDEGSSFWLPLFGNMCCRLVAQPACMVQDACAGLLHQQQIVAGLVGWRRLYCVLRGGKLCCFHGPEEIEASVEPTMVVPIHQETRIRALGRDAKRVHSFSVISPDCGQAAPHVFAADSREALHKWMEAFWQHSFDLSQWKHCCKELMKIEMMSPRKPPLFLTKEATSVYHDMSIDSPVNLESLTDMIQKRIAGTDGQFLTGQDEQTSPPPWTAVFDGHHETVTEKNVSPASDPVHDGKRKKRRAPLPPTDKPPFRVKAHSPMNQSMKDDRGRVSGSEALSSDSKLSTGTRHSQKPAAAAHELLSARKNSSLGAEHSDTTASVEAKPVPAPRQNSILDT